MAQCPVCTVGQVWLLLSTLLGAKGLGKYVWWAQEERRAQLSKYTSRQAQAQVCSACTHPTPSPIRRIEFWTRSEEPVSYPTFEMVRA